MKEFTRSDMMYDLLLSFSRDSIQRELYLSLFSSEIKKFEKNFPALNFKKGKAHNDSTISGKQYHCTITKK